MSSFPPYTPPVAQRSECCYQSQLRRFLRSCAAPLAVPNAVYVDSIRRSIGHVATYPVRKTRSGVRVGEPRGLSSDRSA
jgi:hypothetical protein